MKYIKEQLNNTLENVNFDIEGEFYKGKVGMEYKFWLRKNTECLKL